MVNETEIADHFRSTGMTIHSALIQVLHENFPEVQTRGFWQAVKTLPGADCYNDMRANDPNWAASVKFTPDAFAIHPDQKSLVVFEAVVGHDITAEKLDKLVELAFVLDEDYWSLTLVRFDTSGAQSYNPINVYIGMSDYKNRGRSVFKAWRSFAI